MQKLLLPVMIASLLVTSCGGREETEEIVAQATMDDLIETNSSVQKLESTLSSLKRESIDSLADVRKEFGNLRLQDDALIKEIQALKAEVRELRLAVANNSDRYDSLLSKTQQLAQQQTAIAKKKKHSSELGFSPSSLNQLGNEYVLAVKEYGTYGFYHIGDPIRNGWQMSSVNPKTGEVVFKHTSGNTIKRII